MALTGGRPGREPRRPRVGSHPRPEVGHGDVHDDSLAADVGFAETAGETDLPEQDRGSS